MSIGRECKCNIRVSKDRRKCLDIHAAFKAAGRKRVTQSVNIYDTDTILDEDLLEVTLKVSWLNHRSDRRGEHKPIAWIAVSFQMVDLRLTIPCELLGECRKQRNGADGVSGLRLIDLQNCLVWRIMIGIFDTVQSLRLCEKISVKSKTVIKNDITGATVKSRSNFLQYTTDTVICQDTSAISLMEWSEAERNQADSRRLSRVCRGT